MDVTMNWIQLLHESNDIIEIRSIDPKPVISGYFRADSPAIIAEISKYPRRTFYQTMNCIKPACYAREQHERLIERPKETTSDNDISGYQWILVDADPVRPSGVSASKDEKELARRVAGMAMKKLMAMGFSEPVVADSGNGYHLLFKIHASKEDRQVIADFLSVLDMWFSTDAVKIDTAVFNPARITKLYGTVSAKGTSTPERPHRRSSIIRFPADVKETSMTLVRNIASECKHAVAPKENPRIQGGKSFDIESFLATHGINVTKKVSISTGIKYQLAQCPFDESHQHGDAAVFAYSNGSYGFHCFHNSCAGYHWHEFRQKVDPAAYANSPFTVHQAVNIPKPSGLLSSSISGAGAKTGQPRMLDFAEMQSRIAKSLSTMAKELNVHVHFVCHPRKTEAFPRKGDISGTADLTNVADNVFMVHRINADFMMRYKLVYPKLEIGSDVSNVIEIMKNRDLGIVDEMIKLFFDKRSKTMSDVKGLPPQHAWTEKIEQMSIPGFTVVDDEDLPEGWR